MLRCLAALLSAAVIVAGCGGDAGGEDGTEETAPVVPGAPGAPAGDGQLDFKGAETVVGGLEVPWALAFVDARTILVTERPGRVRVIDGGSLRPEPAAEVAVA
jgi:glucose/arabinose dehydrogenase